MGRKYHRRVGSKSELLQAGREPGPVTIWRREDFRMRLPTVASGGVINPFPETRTVGLRPPPEFSEEPETPTPFLYAYRARPGGMVHISCGINHRLCDTEHDRARVYVVTNEYPEGRPMCPKCLQIDRALDRQMAAHG